MRKPLLTIEQVAEILTLSEWRVYQIVRDGLLPAVRVGRTLRVDPDVLDHWIHNGGQAAPPAAPRLRAVE